MEESITLQDIAQLEGLQYVETTDHHNGYPSYIEGAIIGFENYNQFDEIKKKYRNQISGNFRRVDLYKRDGWQLWRRNYYNTSDKPYTAEEYYRNSDCTLWYKKDLNDNWIACKEFVEDGWGYLFEKYQMDLDCIDSPSKLLGLIKDRCNWKYDKWDLEALEDVLKNHIEVYNAIKALPKSGYCVVTTDEELYKDKQPIRFMSFHDEDVTSYAICLTIK